MGRVRTFRFGPGSLESIELRMWMVPRRDESHARALRTEAVGTYTVYCGAGWEHSVGIDERHTCDPDRPVEDIDTQLQAAWTARDRDAAFTAAGQLVEWALDEWSDPCGNEEDL